MFSIQKGTSNIFVQNVQNTLKNILKNSFHLALGTNLNRRSDHEIKKVLRFGLDGVKIINYDNLVDSFVPTTIDPKERNFLTENKGNQYIASKIIEDIATAYKSLVPVCELKDLSAKIFESVAIRVNDYIDDGTATTLELTRAFFGEGLKIVNDHKDKYYLNKDSDKNLNQNLDKELEETLNKLQKDLYKGVQIAVNEVVKFLEKNKIEIKTKKEITQVATTSANNDKHIGYMIAGAIDGVGKDGAIIIQKGEALKDKLNYIEKGMNFNRQGFTSSNFITDSKMSRCEFKNPLILICDQRISTVNDVLPALKIASKNKRPILIVAEDIEGEALSACNIKKTRDQVQVCCVRSPSFGKNRKEIMKDLGILVNGKVFNNDLDKVELDMLGTCKTVIVTKDETIFIDGAGSKEEIEKRCDAIKKLIEATSSEFEKKNLNERLTKLSGVVASIEVGGVSEVDVNEKIDKFDNALYASRAALEEGIVPGGGIALLKASKVLENLHSDSPNVQLGIDIVKKALKAPFRTFVNNAGGDDDNKDDKKVYEEIYNSYKVDGTDETTSDDKYKPFSYGYDAYNNQFCDMIEKGIIDPVKVIRSSIVDASDVANFLYIEELNMDTDESPVAQTMF